MSSGASPSLTAFSSLRFLLFFFFFSSFSSFSSFYSLNELRAYPVRIALLSRTCRASFFFLDTQKAYPIRILTLSGRFHVQYARDTDTQPKILYPCFLASKI